MTGVEVVEWPESVRAGVESRWQVEYRRAMSGWLLGQRSKHTRRAYGQAWRVWSDWCRTAGLEPTDPGPGAGGAFIACQREAGMSEATVRARCIAVRAALEVLTFEGLRSGADPFGRNRFRDANYGHPQTTGATDVQVRELIGYTHEQMAGRYEVAVRLCAMVGLRSVEAGQVCEATLAAGVGGGVVATVTRKGGARAVVPVPAVIVQAAARDRWPHHADRDEAANANAISRMVAHAWVKAGLPGVVRSHALRHYFCTQALELGVPLNQVQESMGHRSPVTTIGYDDARGRVKNHAAHVIERHLSSEPGTPAGEAERTLDRSAMSDTGRSAGFAPPVRGHARSGSNAPPAPAGSCPDAGSPRA